jgi:hypothetical protein
MTKNRLCFHCSRQTLRGKKLPRELLDTYKVEIREKRLGKWICFEFPECKNQIQVTLSRFVFLPFLRCEFIPYLDLPFMHYLLFQLFQSAERAIFFPALFYFLIIFFIIFCYFFAYLH